MRRFRFAITGSPKRSVESELLLLNLIKEGQTIGLTAGTTTTQLVRNLRHIANLQVVTNGLNIGMELANQTALRVTLTGGSVRWPGAFSLVGPTALESIEHTFMDKIFLGACVSIHATA